MNTQNITDPEAGRFIKQFLIDRQINKDFYQLVPEEKLDFRIVDTPARKSDSPRESLIHQIDTTHDYINGVKSGVLKFGNIYADLIDAKKYSKEQLLQMLEETETELVKILSDPDINKRKVLVPWSNEPIAAISTLWGLDSHEILHTGWNLALIDLLNIPRFPSLIKVWGK
jgi:hypothetical protein